MSPFARITRWLFAIGCIGLAIILLRKGIAGGNLVGAFFPVLVAMILLLCGVVLIVPELVKVFTWPLLAFIDSVFFPGGKASRPVLSYALPDFYVKEERYDEALEEYRKILRYYPKEARAYVGALELLVNEFGDKRAARELFDRARKRLRKHPEDLVAVEACWLQLTNDWITR